MKVFRRFFILAFLSTFLLFGGFLGCKKAEPATFEKVNIAIQPSAAFIPLYVARYKGLIEEALKPLKIDVVWQDFESGPPMKESLEADMTDIGVIGDVPSVSALAGVSPMKIVGIPAKGADAYAMLTLKNNKKFNSAYDMKGKKIATIFGSTGHNFTTKLLAKNNLSFEDIEFISINAGQAEDALVSGLADAVVIWEPNITRLVDTGVAKIVAFGHETDLGGTNAFVVREEYLIKHEIVIKTILEQYYKAVSFIPELDEQTLSKIAEALNISPEQVLKIAEKYDFSVTITSEDIASLQDTVSFLVQIGNLSSQYPVADKIQNIFTVKK